MADTSKLTGARIRFQTHGDNKDHDTSLRVVIKNQGDAELGQVIAEGLSLGEGSEFPDPSTVEIDLVLGIDSLALRDIVSPRITITIHPNGNDRWGFDYTVTLIFDDGSSYAFTIYNIVLDQDNNVHQMILGA